MNLDDALTHLSREPAANYDVAEIALHLARDEYPQLDVEAYLAQLHALAREARGYVRGDLDARLQGLCRFLFHEIGFHGNQKEYDDPRNSYLNDVLDRCTGIPITLSVVLMSVGQQLGMPLVGLGLPGHFVVQCLGPEPALILDPFHGGRRLSLDACEALVARVTGTAIHLNPGTLQPVPPGLLLQRMLNNLRAIYLKTEDYRRACHALGRLHQLSPTDAQVRRDLGIALFHDRFPGKAIDHLASYLQAAPDADDVANVTKVWHAARRLVGRWN